MSINLLWRLNGPSSRKIRLLALIGALVCTAPLAGCKDNGDVTGSINASQPLPAGDEELRAYADVWAKKYDSSPGEKAASINYSRALRALTQYSQAEAVMESAAVKAPKDFDILGAYGKALADAGRLDQAKDVLSRSYTPERPNADFMSARGSVADQLGDHAAAQQFYLEALKILPGEPRILSNLGLSYALTKQLPLAEQTLRQAAASPRADARIRQNLALVLALEGKFSEAEKIGEHDMSADAAAANVAAIRDMIAQSNSWRDIQTLGAKKQKGKSPLPADPSAAAL
jgi:Flp pilus assembly protein TadD